MHTADSSDVAQSFLLLRPPCGGCRPALCAAGGIPHHAARHRRRARWACRRTPGEGCAPVHAAQRMGLKLARICKTGCHSSREGRSACLWAPHTGMARSASSPRSCIAPSSSQAWWASCRTRAARCAWRSRPTGRTSPLAPRTAACGSGRRRWGAERGVGAGFRGGAVPMQDWAGRGGAGCSIVRASCCPCCRCCWWCCCSGELRRQPACNQPAAAWILALLLECAMQVLSHM